MESLYTHQPLSRPDHGCVHLFIGGSVWTFVVEGRLVEVSLADCLDLFAEISEVAVWDPRPISDRQHHRDPLSEQDGRNQVQEPGAFGQED